jgi:hypothetical protein
LSFDTDYFRWPVRFASVGHKTVGGMKQEHARDMIKQKDIVYCLEELYQEEIDDSTLFEHTELMEDLFKGVDNPAMLFQE